MQHLTDLECLFLQMLRELDQQQIEDLIRIMEAFLQSSE